MAETEKRERGFLPRLGYALVVLYCLFGAASILAELIAGKGQALMDLPSPWGAEGALSLVVGGLWFVLTLPLRLYLFAMDFFRNFPTDLIFILIPILFLGFLLFWVYIFGSTLVKMSKAAAGENRPRRSWTPCCKAPNTARPASGKRRRSRWPRPGTGPGTTGCVPSGPRLRNTGTRTGRRLPTRDNTKKRRANCPAPLAPPTRIELIIVP